MRSKKTTNKKQKENMKPRKIIALAIALGAALGTSAFAQPGDHGNGGPHNRPAPPNAATLSTNYAALVSYDTNQDGKLDAAEQSALAQALVDGKPQPPIPPRGREGQTPPTPNAEMASHLTRQMAALFDVIAPYDCNNDGQLDTTEQAAVTAALADGSLKLPKPSGPRGGPPGPPPGVGDAPPQ